MAKRRINIISKEFICGLIGIDPTILKNTSYNNWLKFSLTGFLVLIILFLCFFSTYYGFDLMFHMWYAEILLSTFFSWMFFNIYVFLIQTFSKEAIPNGIKLNFFGISNLSRLAFVFLIGFIIAQPIKAFLLSDQLDHDIENYKASLYNDFVKSNEKLYQSDLTNLERKYQYYQTITQTDRVKEQEENLANEIKKINTKIELENTNTNILIANSGFFVRRIILSNNYPLSHFIVFIILFIFCAPVALIYSISDKSAYYIEKKKADKLLIETEYQRFKVKYFKISKAKFGKEFETIGFHFYEHYQDPPFNTLKKTDLIHLSQEDFFNTFYK